MKALAAVVSLLALTACVSQPANPKQMANHSMACQAYGFKPGSDQFAACMFQMDQNRMAAEQQQIAEARSRIRTAAMIIAATNRPTPTVRLQTNCSRIGSFVSCH